MVYKPNIDGIQVTELAHIPTAGGYVMHGLKRKESSFSGFGEVYFSSIEADKIRGWKKHKEMTLNLIVLLGKIRFVFIDGRRDEKSNIVDDIVLSPEQNYMRLTVPPGVWMAFQGLAHPNNILVNISNREHDPSESDQVDLETFNFVW